MYENKCEETFILVNVLVILAFELNVIFGTKDNSRIGKKLKLSRKDN
jgi:hypothetical protein